MKNTITFILFLTFGAVFSQSECDQFGENYTPKDLNDAIAYLNCKWPEKDKTEYKNKAENDAVAELHFGTGMSIRNNWGLWKGKNKLSKFFKSKGVFHPDDISSIILTSFHRQLNGKPIDLDAQIEFYKSYWKKAQKEYEQTEKGQKELSKKEFDNFKVSDSIKIAFKINKQGKNVWAYSIQKYPDLNEEPNCFINGIITRKKKRTRKRGDYVLTIMIFDICGNEKAIFSEEENGLKTNQEYDFSLENYKISKK
jgi:hypothetical protein